MHHATPEALRAFRRRIWSHYKKHGRYDLPWRRTKDPHHILVSEIMLQQTQVERVIRYYQPFIKKFPDFAALVRTSLADVLGAWQGLGYNRRALHLKRLAEKIMGEYAGKLPHDPSSLAQLPGIGKATAGAIAAFVFGIATPFIETNIRRVYIHFFFPRRRTISDDALMPIIAATMDKKRIREWYYALMDYGAMLGRTGTENPNRRSRHYARQSRFAGSDRELRGKIISYFLGKKMRHANIATLGTALATPKSRLYPLLDALAAEGLLRKKANAFSLSVS